MAEDDDIESYWEDIRLYPPEPVDPIIQLRAEDLARKTIAEELGMDPKQFVGYTFDRFLEVTRLIRDTRRDSTLIIDLHELPPY